MATNLYDSNILTDWTVYIANQSLMGQCPSFQPPDLQAAVESFRGAGMDGEVEVPFGLEKMDLEFDLHTWDAEIWTYFGYGPGSMNTPLKFMGSMFSPAIGIGGGETPVAITVRGLVKSIKTNKIEAGKKVEQTVMMNCSYYRHEIDGAVVTEVDLFKKIYIINGQDIARGRRDNLGLAY